MKCDFEPKNYYLCDEYSGEYYNIHGHIHDSKFKLSDRHINVSVEQVSFKPISLNELILKISAKEG